jgi:hypothetical protein
MDPQQADRETRQPAFDPDQVGSGNALLAPSAKKSVKHRAQTQKMSHYHQHRFD